MVRRTRVHSVLLYVAAAAAVISLAAAGLANADEATTTPTRQDADIAADATTTDTTAAQASASKPEQLQEVLVTAQKTSERLQDVPISVSALDQSAITSLGITDIEDITRLTPGLDYTVGPGGQQIVSVRGVVSTFDRYLHRRHADSGPVHRPGGDSG
jgi:iron complex outermembrane recepter protein